MVGPQRRLATDTLAERMPARALERGTERTEERRLTRPAMRNLTDDGRFSIDLAAVPKGYVMEWKRHSIMNMQDNRNQVTIRAFHWQPVSHKMQPHILGHLCKNEDEHILVDGLGLYMRPRYLNEEAMTEQKQDTNQQLRAQMESIGMASKEQVGSARTFIKKSIAAGDTLPQAIE